MYLRSHAKTFRSIADLARAFNLGAMGVEGEIKKQNKFIGAKVRDTAVKKFGHYQPSIGEYPGWAKLAEATIEAKERAGGAEDPLIGHYARKHEPVWPVSLRNSIEFKVEGLSVKIGSENPLAEIHEYGTAHTPPRPFLRPALFECRDYARERMALAWSNTVRLIAGMVPLL